MTFTLACAATRASQRRTFSHFSINTMSSRSAFDHSRCVVSYSGKSAPSGDRRDDTQQPMALSVEVTPPAQLRVEWLELGPHMHRHIICLPACCKVENSEHANVQPPKRSAVECALSSCVDTLLISKRFNNDVFQTYNALRPACASRDYSTVGVGAAALPLPAPPTRDCCFHMVRYLPAGALSLMRKSWVPCSMMLPRSMTTMLSDL